MFPKVINYDAANRMCDLAQEAQLEKIFDTSEELMRDLIEDGFDKDEVITYIWFRLTKEFEGPRGKALTEEQWCQCGEDVPLNEDFMCTKCGLRDERDKGPDGRPVQPIKIVCEYPGCDNPIWSKDPDRCRDHVDNG
jgi:hypothetical protein